MAQQDIFYEEKESEIYLDEPMREVESIIGEGYDADNAGCPCSYGICDECQKNI